jgi:hypothetical protein
MRTEPLVEMDHTRFHDPRTVDIVYMEQRLVTHDQIILLLVKDLQSSM